MSTPMTDDTDTNYLRAAALAFEMDNPIRLRLLEIAERLSGDNRVRQRGPEGNLEEYVPHVETGHEQRAKEDLVHMLRCLRLIHAAYDADGADLSAWPGRAAQSLERTLDALADEVETSNGLRLQVEALGAQVALALACKNEAETRELQSEQEADDLRALNRARLLGDAP